MGSQISYDIETIIKGILWEHKYNVRSITILNSQHHFDDILLQYIGKPLNIYKEYSTSNNIIQSFQGVTHNINSKYCLNI